MQTEILQYSINAGGQSTTLANELHKHTACTGDVGLSQTRLVLLQESIFYKQTSYTGSRIYLQIRQVLWQENMLHFFLWTLHICNEYRYVPRAGVVYNPARSYTGEHVALCCITPHVPVVIDIKQALGMCSG